MRGCGLKHDSFTPYSASGASTQYNVLSSDKKSRNVDFSACLILNSGSFAVDILRNAHALISEYADDTTECD